MNHSNEIRIKIDSPKGRPTQLSDFSNVCATLRACLTHIGRCLGTDSPSFAVSDLACASATVAVRPMNGDVDIAQTFNQTVQSLEDGTGVDSRLDFAAVRAFAGFSTAIRNKDVRLSVGGLPLTESYSSHLSELLEPQAPAMGSVSGRLEAVSIHGRNKFTLYTPIVGEDVDCRFDPTTLSEVLSAVGRKVTVCGTLYYALTKIFPVRVDVDSFEVTPEDSELSSLLDAKGALAGSNQSALDSQQAMRDEWN